MPANAAPPVSAAPNTPQATAPRRTRPTWVVVGRSRPVRPELRVSKATVVQRVAYYTEASNGLSVGSVALSEAHWYAVRTCLSR
jgi:hypothetical protein